MSAPSFSSFPPSFSSFPDPTDAGDRAPQQPKSSQTPSGDDDPSPRQRDRKTSRSSTRHSWGKHTGYRYSDDEARKSREDRRSQRAGSSKDQDLFYSDRKGDPLNMTYGGLHAGDVPKYHLVDRGRRILGLGSGYTVSRRTGKSIEVLVGTKRFKLSSLEDTRSRAALNAPPKRRLISTRDTYKYPEVDGFLRVVHKSMHDDTVDRSVYERDDESDTDFPSDSSDGSADHAGGRFLTATQLAIKCLEDELLLSPSSESCWLSLVSHSLSLVPTTTKNGLRTRAEIKVSILMRALQASRSNANNRVLRLNYLRAGQQVWHESKLRAEWESALQIGGIDLWMAWLEWRLHLAKDSISGIVQDATRVLTALGDDESAELSKLRVMWRVALAFQQAGFYERATALFQAQAELSLQMPPASLNQPFNTCLDSLEEFWDSEMPRMGEPDAKGWASWITSGCRVTPHSPQRPLPRKPQESQDPFVGWYNEEAKDDATLRNPARTVDSRSENDAFAAVLFSDVRPLLIRITSDRSKKTFRLVWLSLLGLHIPGFLDSLSPGSWDDTWAVLHLSTSFMDAIFPPTNASRNVTSDSHAGAIIGRERMYGSTFGPIKEWAFNTLRPLDCVSKERWRMWSTLDTHHVDVAFVRGVFQQLRFDDEDYEWDEYALAFEASINVKGAIKLSRSLLANARDSVPRWIAHAKLERLHGRPEEARKVYQMVSASGQLDSMSTVTRQLWWDWSEMEWLQGRSDAALSVIMQSASVPGSTGIAILRAKRHLDERVDGRDRRHQVWLQLRALLELITSSPEATLTIFDTYLANSRDSTESSREGVMVASLLLLYHHSVTLRNTMPPSLLRDRLLLAIKSYPSNTIIMGMFLECEKGYGVWGRIRGMLGESVAYGAQDKGVIRRVMEVWVTGWERGNLSTEIERLRLGLAAAVNEVERTQGSVTLWRIYLELELRMKDFKRAKSLLYQAIHACPLVKEFYLLAFGPMRSCFTSHELRAFADTMAERGIRMRGDLEEFLQLQKHRSMIEDGSGESSDGDSGDEIEQEAKERRRLMPY
ncbi:hypothetical protein CONPUDRAFT_134183 [Coniophora puteana RWD-64-598 SS2]|uniref:DUF1740-domain-containing protein n=1 Tax=Coniophora puteana (strain RWD-64-598) TaxID=741705 RepID=A0A5M3N6F3_CONPW|nr:uncharacterized protein CONPUDRAFT_134183 [Coniophora puteana RWD-64-598 SS2]EIW86838.1 hypothetical protein CONPUDRAFT_134183 [Coniophora puteana RWD-64-598 SS2]